MLNDAYAHSAAMRVRRLSRQRQPDDFLRGLLKELSEYPDLSKGRVSADELAADIDELDQGTSKVKDYVDQFIAHHDRSPVATAPIHRELNAAIELLIRLLRKYYGVLAGSDIDVVVSYLEDPSDHFSFCLDRREGLM